MTDKELEKIYNLTFNNAEFLDEEENEDTRTVGCISCKDIFTIQEGREQDLDGAYTVIDNRSTVLCPFCNSPSLIFEDSGVNLTPELLDELNKKYLPDINKRIDNHERSTLVSQCLKIAVEAHWGQTDLDGNPVILHPLTVGLMGKTYEEQCAGFLHDVVEDTDVTFDDLLGRGIHRSLVDALRLLTHEDGTAYMDYIRRIIESGNKTAIAVKLNDLHHNLERGRRAGYQKLVAKHEEALAEFKRHGYGH